MKQPRFSSHLPLDCWENPDDILAGFAGEIQDSGLLVFSVHKIEVGTRIAIAVYYLDGYQLSSVEVRGKVVWRDYIREPDWKGYKYGVELIGMSQRDREILATLLPVSRRSIGFCSGEENSDQPHSSN